MKKKNIMKAAITLAIVITLTLPIATVTAREKISPMGKQLTGSLLKSNNNGNNMDMLSGVKGIFHGNVSQDYINLSSGEMVNIPMGTIDGYYGEGTFFGLKVIRFVATWDSPFSHEPFSMKGLSFDEYVIGTINGEYPFPGDPFSSKYAGIYRIPNPSDPVDFYVGFIVMGWHGEFVVEGYLEP